jgi:hypothetical protein
MLEQYRAEISDHSAYLLAIATQEEANRNSEEVNQNSRALINAIDECVKGVEETVHLGILEELMKLVGQFSDSANGYHKIKKEILL